MKVVIVGGVAGGATAAARMRRMDEFAEITVFERTGYVSYSNCGLPYYVGEVVQNPKALTLRTPQDFKDRFDITVKVKHDVQAINRDKKTVTVKDLSTGLVFEEPYDKLLLSPGAVPYTPEVPGVDSPLIFMLHTVEETYRLHDYIQSTHPKSALVVGGGFIGLEAAENLQRLGIQTQIVQRGTQVMNPFDPEMAALLQNELREKGVTLRLNSNIASFETQGGQMIVNIQRQKPATADLVVLAIGVRPASTLAKEAGLKLGIRDCIAVDDTMRTSDPDIYAVGDAVSVLDIASGKEALIQLAGPANREARVAADSMTGREDHYKGSQGSLIIQVFDLTAAATGINEKQAQKLGLDYDKVYLQPDDHTDVYPGATAMLMKVLFEKGSTRLLGAQIVGQGGVDKRMDVLSTALRAGTTGMDLKNLDLCYAPPYSSAKDPVNMAGFMIEDVTDGLLRQYFWDQVDNLPRDGSVSLVDVRTPNEYEHGHIDGAVNIPLDTLRERLDAIPKDRPVYVNCYSGLRGYIATRILNQRGYNAYNLSGGFVLYDAQRQNAAAERAEEAACTP